jgi:uncharacterized protein
MLAITLGLLAQVITPSALIPIILLPLALYYQRSNVNIRVKVPLYFIAILLSFGLTWHIFPGFHNLKVLNHIHISKDAIPFTLYLNFDIALVGFFILGISHRLITHKKDWLTLFKQIPLPLGVLIILSMLLAISLGLVHFDPKLPKSLPLWALTNLLGVSVAEEALFRGYILLAIIKIANSQLQLPSFYLAIVIVALLFGLLHYPGGSKYMLLATVAGIGYGWVYAKTQRIEAAIITHFSLNLTHFIFFTYPMLA